MPNAKILSKIIAQSIGETKEYELKEIAEYAVEEFKKDKRKLDDFIEKMKDLFYIQKPSKAQIDIMSTPWKEFIQQIMMIVLSLLQKGWSKN